MTPTARRRARAVLAAGSKSFALAGRLLPRAARADAAVCYAYCRRADDLIDDGRAPAAALAGLRAELEMIYAGSPPADPILEAFADVVRRRGIPRAYPEALLDGFAMDAAGLRYASHTALDVYCYRVAGVVGLMMCHVLGVTARAALPHAAHLGMAMQLTNICRDVVEDWGRGRLYLPLPALLPSLADDTTPPRALRGPLAAGVRALLARAAALYDSGQRGLGYLGWRSAFAIRVAAAVYQEIGAVLAARDFDVFARRAIVPWTRKLALVARAARATLAEAPARLARLARPRTVAALQPTHTADTPPPPLRFPDDIPLPA